MEAATTGEIKDRFDDGNTGDSTTGTESRYIVEHQPVGSGSISTVLGKPYGRANSSFAIALRSISSGVPGNAPPAPLQHTNEVTLVYR